MERDKIIGFVVIMDVTLCGHVGDTNVSDAFMMFRLALLP